MTFGAQESSRQNGSPITLVMIRYGSGANNFYALTNAEQVVQHGGVEGGYKPISIKHSSIKRLITLDDTTLTLSLPSSHPMATRWRGYPPTEVTSVVIRQGHADSNDFKVKWLGRVLGHRDVQGGVSEFVCEPRSSSLLRGGLSRNWQHGCPLLLYSQGEGLCNADKARATREFPITAADGGRVSLGGGFNDLGAARLDYLTGMVEWRTSDGRREVRSIMAINEQGVMTLDGPVKDLNIGDTIKASWGCNHRPYAPEGDCQRLHANIVNYGGQPLIPTENPIGIKLGSY